MSAPGFFSVSRRHTLAQDAWAVAFVFALAGVIGASVVGWRRGAPTVHPTVSLDELRTHVATGEALIVDARDPADFATGHIPGALNLPLSVWATRSDVFRARDLRDVLSRFAIVYCENPWCGQAEELQVALVNDGHRLVGLFPGGMEAWRAAGLPVEGEGASR